jgi:hypothetical protein
VPGIRNPLMISGVPVIAAPTEIDVTTAEQLRTVLLHAAGRGQATIVEPHPPSPAGLHLTRQPTSRDQEMI